MIYRLCETHLANLSLNIFAKWKQTEAFMNKTYCEKMQFRAGDAEMEPYALLKRQLRYSTHGPALRLHLNRPHA